MTRLSGASDVTIGDGFELEGAVSVITDSAKIYIPIDELIDIEAEKTRLKKELKATEKEIVMLTNKLNNEGFLSKAPAKVVEAGKEALKKNILKKELLTESLMKL